MKRQENPNTRKDVDKQTGKARVKRLKKQDQLITRLRKVVREMRKHGFSAFRIRQEIDKAMK